MQNIFKNVLVRETVIFAIVFLVVIAIPSSGIEGAITIGDILPGMIIVGYCAYLVMRMDCWGGLSLKARILREMLIMFLIIFFGFFLWNTGKREGLQYELRECRRQGKYHRLEHPYPFETAEVLDKVCRFNVDYKTHPGFLRMVLLGKLTMKYGYIIYLPLPLAIWGIRKLKKQSPSHS